MVQGTREKPYLAQESLLSFFRSYVNASAPLSTQGTTEVLFPFTSFNAFSGQVYTVTD